METTLPIRSIRITLGTLRTSKISSSAATRIRPRSLDGFVIQGGNDEYGGAGINIITGSPTIRNCDFIGHKAGNGGAAILNNYSSHPLIENCRFMENSAPLAAAVFSANSSSPTIRDCTFQRNRAGNYGGSGW